MLKRAILCAVLAMALVAGLVMPAERIGSYVVDDAGVFTAEEKAMLESRLRQLAQETNGVQLVIFAERSIPIGMSLEDRSLSIAQENGVGKKGADNGILFYIATNDRRFRWEVGYGAEATLGAALLGRISREYMVPKFREGDFSAGILEGVSKVIGVVLNSEDADIVKLKDGPGNVTGRIGKLQLILNLMPLIFFLLVLTSAVNAIHKRKKYRRNDKSDAFFYGAATGLLFRGGKGGLGGSGLGGFGGGGGSFGGGGFSGKF